MPDLSVRFHNISFTYDGASRPLIQNLSIHFPQGWTGVVGANGAGKSTVLQLATGELKTSQGQVASPPSAIYCPQRTDAAPEKLPDLIHAACREAFQIRGRLGVQEDWPERWTTLSHGERKRAQIAVALWRRPHALAVDEPTNHLDEKARAQIFDALSRFPGVGLLVSHDRRLLDDLCLQCLFLAPQEAVLRPGNYSCGLGQAEQEEKALRKQYAHARQELSRLKREAARRRDAASQANRKRSKRGLAPKDHDAREKINVARVTGKDGSAGKQFDQLRGRLDQARQKQNNIQVKKTYKTGIWMPGAKSRRNSLFHLPAGALSLGKGRKLHYPDLSMRPEDRIALTGLNGCGKSTMIAAILQSLNLPLEYITYLPQEIDLRASQDVMAGAKNLPREKLGKMMTVVSCLGSRPGPLLESLEPSPGEIRKVLLATGIASTPHLIIMDEPTNHLDLPSIQCLEEALLDCPCGLLLVSHDKRFLGALTQTRWHISRDRRTKGDFLLEIQ